jgi:hypothetical protein
MKASDSTNSLTELQPSEPSCFICLSTESELDEPLVPSSILRTCGCKFAVHPACWNEWIKNKSDYDCPICRKDSMMRIKIPPNPVLTIVYQEQPERQTITPARVLCVSVCIAVTCILVIAIVKWG